MAVEPLDAPAVVAPHPRTESELVEAAQAGSHAAFKELVEIYQTAICSLALALTGSVTQSEEIAQEAFLAAWRGLFNLRDPAAFRSWMFRIARHEIHRFKKNSRALALSAPLPSRTEIPSHEPSPLDRVITREEEQLAWHALARIPEVYRVTLVMYYREQQSVEKVAELLGMGEESVRKRLSRGRKLLHQQVTATLKHVLGRTRPGAAFTAAVALALASTAPPATAASAKGRHPQAGAAGALRWAGAAIAVAVVVGGAFHLARRGRPGDRAAAVQPAVPVGSTALRPTPAWSPGSNLGAAAPADLPAAGSSRSPGDIDASEVVLSFDFESGIIPNLFDRGTLVALGGNNRFAIQGTETRGLYSNQLFGSITFTDRHVGAGTRPGLFEYAPDLVVTFDYWVGSPEIWLQVSFGDTGTGEGFSYVIERRNLVQRSWAHASLRLADFSHWYGPRVGVARWVNLLTIDVRDDPKAVLIDNLAVVRKR